MLQLRNQSPFAPSIAVFPNRAGVDTLYVVVKASFRLGLKLRVADMQPPPALADEYYGETGRSSLRQAGEMHLGKPATDFVVRGSARAEDGKLVSSLRVELQLAERSKAVQVFGDREYRGASGFSVPEPFAAMPLVYERAFGGALTDPSGKLAPLVEAKNPVGRGLAIASKRARPGELLPNLEDPAQLIGGLGAHPQPACPGFVAASWQPRCALGGTYDARWSRQRAPFLPADFDRRYFQQAAPELIFDRHLHGGEPARLVGLSAHGPLSFVLPHCALRIVVRVRGRQETLPVALETVLIDADDELLQLTFRAELACDKTILQVEQVDVSLDALDFVDGAAR